MHRRNRLELRVLLGLYEEEGHGIVRQLEEARLALHIIVREEAWLTDRIVQGCLGLGAVQIRLPQLQPWTRLHEPH
jgi:hypothetical protein